MNSPSGPPTEDQLRRQIVDIGRRLAEHALVVATEGNISARLDSNRLLVTPAGVAKGRLSENSLIVVDASGNQLSGPAGRPSSELGMHLCVYRTRPDVRACVHAHPPYAVACSVAGIAMNQPVLPEVAAVIGEVAVADYATPGTAEVAAAISPLVGRHNAVILSNHGVLTVGPDLEAALYRMEIVEHLAQVVFLAHQLGRVNALSSEQLRRLNRAIRGE